VGSPSVTKTTVNGKATATLTADAGPGTATVSAKVDNQTVTTTVTISSPSPAPTTTPAPTATPTPTAPTAPPGNVDSGGGTVQSGGVTVTIPPGVVPDGSTIVITPIDPATTPVPPVGVGVKMLGTFVEINVYAPDGTLITTFASPLLVCLPYTAADLIAAGGNPWNIVIGVSHAGGAWQMLSAAVVNPASMQVCSYVYNLSLFGTFVPALLPATGFAPGRMMILPEQPAALAYTTSNLWLEIPRLNVQMDIVGVPLSADGWDVSWLGKQAGWLQGTAFPTWAGNSGITGHVWNADNTPGPFAYLNWMWYGDKIIVHAWGQQYVYEVRSVRLVSPGNIASITKHEELPWLTLVTCKGYDEASNSYQYRIVVRAVQVEIK
ncbi:MAG: sortase, partial [Anaerolineales bacterium]|nr:sortase [Anaerolineales bacterium]